MTTTMLPNGKKKVWNVAKWIVGVFISFVGLLTIRQSILAGIIFLVLGSLIIPPIYTKWWNKIKFLHQRLHRWIACIVLLLLALIITGISIPKEEKERMSAERKITAENKRQAKEKQEAEIKKKPKIKKKAKEEIVEPEDTLPLISYTIEKEAINLTNVPEYFVLIDKVSLPDTLLRVKIEKLVDEIVKKKGAMIAIDIFDHKETLEKTYADEILHQFSSNNSAVIALVKLQEKHYIATFTGETEKLPEYSNMIYMFPAMSVPTTYKYLPTTRNSATAKKQEDDLKKANAAREKKKAKFEDNCFSSWDGSCRELVNYVKENMNNPKSFEHVKTTYTSLDKYAVVIMVYRGTNGFGATVTEQVRAEVSYDCEVLRILN